MAKFISKYYNFFSTGWIQFLEDPNISNLYIEYSFLDVPQEDLETPFSLPKPNPGEKITFNFRKENLSILRNLRQIFGHFLDLNFLPPFIYIPILDYTLDIPLVLNLEVNLREGRVYPLQ